MRLRIEDIPEGSSSVSENIAIDLPEPEFCKSSGDGIPCRADIERNGENLHIRVVFGGKVRVRCARCLGVFDLPVDGELRLVRGTGDADGGDESDDAALYFEGDGHVNIGAAVFDEVLTGLPLMPLCSASCKGGEFRFKAADGASPRKDGAPGVDPRWEPLQRLGKRS